MLLAIAIFSLSAYSCGNNKKNQETHTHADGTVHAGSAHAHHHDAANQESFAADSTACANCEKDATADQEGHNHDHGHEGHDHGHQH